MVLLSRLSKYINNLPPWVRPPPLTHRQHKRCSSRNSFSSPIHIQIRRRKHNKTRRARGNLAFLPPFLFSCGAIFFAFMMPSKRPTHDLLTGAESKARSLRGFHIHMCDCSPPLTAKYFHHFLCGGIPPPWHSVAATVQSNRWRLLRLEAERRSAIKQGDRNRRPC